MCTTEHLQDQIKTLFREKLNLEVPTAETDLVEAGVLDSLQLINLLLHLERELGTRVSPEDLKVEHFRSIASIAAFVDNQLRLLSSMKTTEERIARPSEASASVAQERNPSDEATHARGQGRIAPPVLVLGEPIGGTAS